MIQQQYRVSEIFGPTIQGEGAQIGRPTVFVRFGGCDYRCSWCDSMYAVDPINRSTWEKMSAAGILKKVDELSDQKPILVTLSGGNPALWNLEKLLDMGQEAGHTFTMETQGTSSAQWWEKLDHLCLSPKPPSSGMVTDYDKLAAAVAAGPADTILKVVVFDDTDFEYARDIRQRYPNVPLYLQVGNRSPTGETNIGDLLASLESLSLRVIMEGWFNVRVLPQLHVLMWGNKRAV